MQINYVGVLILLWIVSTAWIVSGYLLKVTEPKTTSVSN